MMTDRLRLNGYAAFVICGDDGLALAIVIGLIPSV
jgi:hypothetical protein